MKFEPNNQNESEHVEYEHGDEDLLEMEPQATVNRERSCITWRVRMSQRVPYAAARVKARLGSHVV